MQDRPATLNGYVSRLAATLALETRETPAPARKTLEAAVLLADLSGFTALTERFSREGNCDGLVEILNRTFGILVDRILDHGGDVLKFAGDALVAAWPAEAESPEVATQRAAACGLALAADIERLIRESEVALRIKVDLALGELSLMSVGGIFGRWELLVTGEPLEAIGAAANRAGVGQVMAHGLAADLLEHDGRTDSIAGGGRLIWGIDRPGARPARTEELLPADLAGRYVPGAVLNRVATGDTDWLADMRPVTAMFVKLDGLSHATSLEDAQRLIQLLQVEVYRREGSLNKLSVDEKGILALVVFGLPPFSHPDDPTRAVETAMALDAMARNAGRICHIGIATGRVFCGEVGNTRRREYTVIGDAINLAARLTTSKKARVVIDRATRDATGRYLDVRVMEPLQLKGKADPVEAFEPVTLRSSESDRPQLVGRQAQVRQLDGALENLQRRTGHPAVVHVTGIAGIGKTSLIRTWLQSVEAQGVAHSLITIDPFVRTSPFEVWQKLLCLLYGFERPDRTGREQLRQDLALCAMEPEELALLSDWIPREFSTATLVPPMDAGDRVRRTRVLVRRLFAVLSQRGERVIAFEGIEFMDEASLELLRQVLSDGLPWMFILTGRESQLPEALGTGDTPWLNIELEHLSEEACLELVRNRSGALQIAHHLIQLLHRRSGGLPAMATAMIDTLLELGMWVIQDGTLDFIVQERPREVPATLDALISSSLDRLEPGLHLHLKLASLLGREFSIDLLHRIHPARPDMDALRTDLDRLIRMHHLEIVMSGKLAFESSATQKVLISRLLGAQKQDIHRAAARCLEEAMDELGGSHEAIARHWELAGAPDRAVTHHFSAARHFEEFNALRDAMASYGAILDGGKSVTREDRIRAHLGIASAARKLGRMQDAVHHAEAVTSELGWRVPDSKPKQVLALGLEVFGLTLSSLSRLFPVSRRIASTHDHMQNEALRILTEGHFHLGHQTLRLLTASRGLRRLEQHGDLPERSSAHAGFSLMLLHRGLHLFADGYLRWAIKELTDLPDSPETCEARFLIGHIHGNRDRYAMAVGDLQHAREMAMRLGLPRYLYRADLGAGLAAARSGNIHQAETFLDRARSGAAEFEDLQTTFEALITLIHLALERRDLDRARALLAEVPPLLENTQDPSFPLDFQAQAMRCTWLEGRLDEATASFEQVLTVCLAERPGRYEISSYVALAEVGMHHIAADRERYVGPGTKAVTQLVRTLESWPTRRALVAWYRARLARVSGHPVEADRWFRRGIRIAKHLGPDQEHVRRLCETRSDRFWHGDR